MRRFAVLTSVDSLTGGYVIRALLDAGLVPVSVVLDGLPTKPRDVAIHAERTASRLPALPIDGFADRVPNLSRFEDHNATDCVSFISDLNVDFVVNAGTPRILKREILASTPAILNCHPGLLPWFRGSSAVEWALYLNEPVGNTVHLMTEGIDEGAILTTERVAVSRSDTYQDIRVNVFCAGFSLFSRTIGGLVAGTSRLSDATAQSSGRYFRPIPQLQFERAMSRLDERAYDGSVLLGSSATGTLEPCSPATR